jgi:hypothetical protein
MPRRLERDAKPLIMPLVPRCAERETASTIIDQQLPQLMREPCSALGYRPPAPEVVLWPPSPVSQAVAPKPVMH